MLLQIQQGSKSAWPPIKLQGVPRVYQTQRILDQKIILNDYQGEYLNFQSTILAMKTKEITDKYLNEIINKIHKKINSQTHKRGILYSQLNILEDILGSYLK